MSPSSWKTFSASLCLFTAGGNPAPASAYLGTAELEFTKSAAAAINNKIKQSKLLR